MHAATPVDLDRASALRPLLLGGLALGLAFFGGLGGWAATAPLAGAVVAPATVAPEGHRKVVQHLEGGIVSPILVREGDRVEAGQPLVLLDDTRVRAEAGGLEAQLHAARAALARLRAEDHGEATVTFEPDLLAAATSDPLLAAAMRAESDQLAARAAALDGQLAVLAQRADKERGAVPGLEVEIDAYTRQAAFLDEEIESVDGLVTKGLERRSRLLSLRRERSQLDGSLASARASVERSRREAEAAELEAQSLRRQRAADVARDLTAAQALAAELGERLKAARDRLERTVVRAPAAGTVVTIKPHTTGGVIGAGEPILDLVPADDPLVLEARIQPNDIDEVTPGHRAQVYLTAYQVRRLPRLVGVVDYVSADRLTDQANPQQPYYTARVVVSREEVARLGKGVVLTPGMPAEALIVTRKRTMLDYLMAPVTELFRSGMRES